MACSNCGYSGAYSSHSCPNCNPGGGARYAVEDAERDRKAGYEAGYGLVRALHWLLTNRYLSYVWFWLIWVIGSYILGLKFGWISEDWDKNRPFTFDVVSVFLPIGIVIVFRNQVAKYLPMLFEKLLQLTAWALIIFVCALLGMCVWNTVT